MSSFLKCPCLIGLYSRCLKPILLAARDAVCEAFAAFMGIASPGEFWNDRDYVEGQWRAPHTARFKIEQDGVIAGAAEVARWGNPAVVGPVAVLPKYWDRKLAKALMAAVDRQLDTWQVRHAGVFTFPESLHHLGLYQGFGFWPQALMERKAVGTLGAPLLTVAALGSADLADCAALTHGIAEGLDVRGELQAVKGLKLGENLLLRTRSRSARGVSQRPFLTSSRAMTMR